VQATARLDRTSVLEGGDGLVRMELRLKAARRALAQRVPTDLVVVLDRSGSMQGSKLRDAKQAVIQLMESLGGEDRFALVSYAAGANLTVPMAAADPAARAHWHGLVREIRAAGGTDMSSGLDLAMAALEGRAREGRAGRLILISDGHANQGDSSLEGLSRRASQASRQEVVLTTVGVGADFNQTLMTALADAGTGNYYYLSSGRGLARVFADEFQLTRSTVAGGLTVELEPADGVQVEDAAGYPLERRGGVIRFSPGSLGSGQERRIWISYRVPSKRPGTRSLGALAVRWRQDEGERSLRLAALPRVACVSEQQQFIDSVDKDVWERSVLEEAYGALQQRVADHVRKGEKEAAASAIERYRQENRDLNRMLESEAVGRSLQDVDSLGKQVEDAFSGRGQAAKQNRFSKQQQAGGRDRRRAGSKLGQQ
jgi:Ca-activated chloride channel family protein